MSDPIHLPTDKSHQSLKALAQSFWRNQSGVASIEFVLTFPILISLFFGCIELYGHFHAVRKLSNVTASLADIVAQSRAISSSQLNALQPLSKSLMAPLDATNISYSIANVRQGDASEDPKLVWEHTQGGGTGKTVLGGSNSNGAGACKKFNGSKGKDFPPDQDSIFVVVSYTYNSLFANYIGGSTTYEDTMLAVPRASKNVKITGKSECS